MLEFSLEEYNLKYISETVSFKLVSLNEAKKSALNEERRKVYVVKNQNDFLYVGEANTSMTTRLQRGFTSFRYAKRNNGKGRNGYCGYKWINCLINEKLEKLTVFVAVFCEDCDENRNVIESIEGELVFLIRNETGNWPLYQNEIHFNNNEVAKNTANKIWESLKAETVKLQDRFLI